MFVGRLLRSQNSCYNWIVPFKMRISQALYITPSILLQHSRLKRSFLPFKETTSHSDDKGNGTNLTIDITVDITVIHMTHVQFSDNGILCVHCFAVCMYMYTVDDCEASVDPCNTMQVTTKVTPAPPHKC